MNKTLPLRTALPALVVFALHASLFGSWIVDDAGISYAYARNLSQGEGLVAQIGIPPVEGFSNALWTVLLAAADAIGVFHPVATAKILATLLVGMSSVFLSSQLVGTWGRSALAIGLGLSVTAAATPFVVWTVSGLENALFVCLLSGMAALSLHIVRKGIASVRETSLLAIGCFLLFLTRPDGLLYLGVPPFLMGLVAADSNRTRSLLVRFGLTFVLLFWSVTILRIAYFGDVLPNTYYAKEGPLWQVTAASLESLGVVVGGLAFTVVASALVFFGLVLCFWIGEGLARKVVEPSPLVVLGAFVFIGVLSVKRLPTDWMPEYRFGTPLFLFGPLLALEVSLSIAGVRRYKRVRWVQLVVGSTLLVGASVYSARHTPSFLTAPTVPVQNVQSLSISLDRLSRRYNLDRPLILLPDIGGSLWEDRFEVLDLAGLTDRTIGRTHIKYPHAFEEYIRKRSPDFVWMHGNWLKRSQLIDSDWFAAEYVVCSAAQDIDRIDGALYRKASLAE